MHAAAERLEFAPPDTPGLLRALVLAALAHLLLVAALTWGVHWKRDVEIVSAEAELWAAVPVAAAPKLQEPPPEPPPPPEPQPVPKPAPKPAPEPPPAPVVEPPKVDIALEQEKRRILKQKQLDLAKQQEKLQLAKQKLEKLKLEKQQAEKLKLEKLKAAQVETAKLNAEKLKADKLKQTLADKAKQAQDKKQLEAQAKQLEVQREKNLQRMTGLAGASGGPTSTGNALKSAGPSASYAGRIRARIKPNIVFTEDIAGNPTAEVEVRTSPDGTIIARKLIKSSGDKAWDQAVLKAIDKTEVLPRDTDGRVPPVLEISFKAKD
ncbi:MAG: cell envelope integrity protein TolA [Rhodoferax sp.]|uniref:cell envelope integrity protein TolA n=1 Tax=Rhodoferax sp. TaxID=50421 RepID=UPI002630A772|nr:cell envelope integrity protein TolA [Rhodoferax sp.]MDD2881723.1 cell envelope integrity protein TolA [Rhodoferax sp.]